VPLSKAAVGKLPCARGKRALGRVKGRRRCHSTEGNSSLFVERQNKDRRDDSGRKKRGAAFEDGIAL